MGCDSLGLQTEVTDQATTKTTTTKATTTTNNPTATSSRWLDAGRQAGPLGGPATVTTLEAQRTTQAAVHTSTTAQEPSHQPPDSTGHQPTNGQLMSILQTLLHNQQQDSTTIRDGMRSIHDRLDATDNRMDHHERVMQKLDDRINQLPETATGATRGGDSEADKAFAALHARLDALEQRQRQQGATTTTPILRGPGGAGGEFTMVLGNFPKDTPANEALRAARRLLAALPSGPRLVLAPSPFSSSSADAQQMPGSDSRAAPTTKASSTYPPPVCRIYSPCVLTSTVYMAFLNPLLDDWSSRGPRTDPAATPTPGGTSSDSTQARSRREGNDSATQNGLQRRRWRRRPSGTRSQPSARSHGLWSVGDPTTEAEVKASVEAAAANTE